ncbi:MAG TPA: YdeI/OmpD-associated family protein [Sphingomicrobium sp.]|nr:YdeI/OmpD-associated family protein [Sphingomicrobium sp.]
MTREARIDAYIAKAQPFARPILEKVRERVHAVVPDVEEAMKWSMPAYMLGGKLVLICAAFKAHTALNFWRGQELGGEANADAMGQFGKIKSLDELPTDAELDRLIREAADLSKSAPAPRKAKHEPKPAIEIHPQFAEALEKAPKSKAALEAFPPSAQRDYFEWISEAKQDSTREKRIATALEWLSEGKRRHWKYQNC